MSINTEITRLSGAKSDIATAIVSKGVTVPAATTLDGYAALINSIVTGGGSLLSCFDALAFEDFTLTADITDRNGPTISHSLGAVPNHIILWCKVQHEPASSSQYWQYAQYTQLTNKLLLGTTALYYISQFAVGYSKNAIGNLSFISSVDRNENYGIHSITNSQFILGSMTGTDPFPAGDYWLLTAKFKDAYLQANG